MRQEVTGTIVPDTDPRSVLAERLAAARAALAASTQQLAATYSRLQDTRAAIASGRSRREQLHELAYARLRAQLETMPVIEQAKGILIAQTGCEPEEAFDMLRKASQRSNVRVSELAAGIVQRTVTSYPASSGPPRPCGARAPRRPSPG